MVDILPVIRPGAEWAVTDNNLSWLDKQQPRPTVLEIQNAITACKSQPDLKTQALIDVKNDTLSSQARIDALLKVLNIN